MEPVVRVAGGDIQLSLLRDTLVCMHVCVPIIGDSSGLLSMALLTDFSLGLTDT